MGGIFKGGGIPEQTNKEAIQEFQKDAAAMQPKSQATAQAVTTAEDKAARRRARRGGRAMLSDTRLNPEQGVTTLGSVVQ